MGCCSSRETRPSPYSSSPPHPAASEVTHNPAASSSRAAIILTPAAVAARNNSSVSRISSSAPTSDRAQRTADGRPNAPLRAPSPVAKSPAELTLSPWTRTELHRQREAFFETRVSGSQEVWSAMRLVCEMLRAGELKEAQGVLDAAGLTCPTGRVVGDRRSRKAGRGVYDEKGLLYEIPGWVVRDPEDLVDEEKRSLDMGDNTEVDEEEAVRKRDEKGKGREVDVGESVSVRARLSDRGTDVLVAVGKEQKVAVLIKRIQEKAGLSGKVRLAYMGKMMDENKTLADGGWREGHVINALVFE